MIHSWQIHDFDKSYSGADVTPKTTHYEMRLQEGFIEDVCVIKAEGRLTLGKGTTAFREYIQRRIADGQRNFVWDFSELRYLDSAGVGEFVGAAARVRMRTGKIVCIPSPAIYDYSVMNPQVRPFFEIAHNLTSAFTCFPGRSEQPEHDVKYEDKFAITVEKDESEKKMVVTDNISDKPERVEYNVRDIPPEESPKRLTPSSLILVVFVGLVTLGVTIAGLVWTAKVISSVVLLVLIFTIALLIFIVLSAVVLLLSGHLSEKSASKLFGGVLGKLPGLSAFVPKSSGPKSDH